MINDPMGHNGGAPRGAYPERGSLSVDGLRGDRLRLTAVTDWGYTGVAPCIAGRPAPERPDIVLEAAPRAPGPAGY